MMRRLGLALGLLIAVSALVQLAVFGWHTTTHGDQPHGAASVGIYLLALGIPALVMLFVGALITRACWPRAANGRRAGSSTGSDK